MNKTKLHELLSKSSEDIDYAEWRTLMDELADLNEDAPDNGYSTKPPECSICRRRHGLEIIHACE